MSNVKIRDMTDGALSSNNDYFTIANSSGATVKLSYGNLARFLLSTSLIQGDNITITDATETDGIVRFRVSAAGGSVWYFGSTQPSDANEGDYWLRSDTGHYGEVDNYDGTAWTQVGTFAGRDGTDGTTPHIDSTTKHWIIGETDTGIVAEGQDGTNGTTPHIDPTTKHWFIGETDTNIVAEGQDGSQGQQGIAGNDGASISFIIAEIIGGHSVTVSSTDESVEDQTFNVMDGENGDSVTATVTSITGGHRVTISSTNSQIADQSFDIMDGIEYIQTTSDNRQITLLASDWVGDAVPYTQTVAFTGMTANVVPEIGVILSDTVETGIEQQKQWGYITRAVSDTNTITFYCYKNKPTIDLTANVKAV